MTPQKQLTTRIINHLVLGFQNASKTRIAPLTKFLAVHRMGNSVLFITFINHMTVKQAEVMQLNLH